MSSTFYEVTITRTTQPRARKGVRPEREVATIYTQQIELQQIAEVIAVVNRLGPNSQGELLVPVPKQGEL